MCSYSGGDDRRILLWDLSAQMTRFHGQTNHKPVVRHTNHDSATSCVEASDCETHTGHPTCTTATYDHVETQSKAGDATERDVGLRQGGKGSDGATHAQGYGDSNTVGSSSSDHGPILSLLHKRKVNCLCSALSSSGAPMLVVADTSNRLSCYQLV